MMKKCTGWPTGHECVVAVPLDRIWCHGCTAQRQKAIAAGIPASGMLPVGTILEDFESPVLTCGCGGDATMPDHEHSLTHMSWAWSRDPDKRIRPLSADLRLRLPGREVQKAAKVGGLQSSTDEVSFSQRREAKENE